MEKLKNRGQTLDNGFMTWSVWIADISTMRMVAIYGKENVRVVKEDDRNILTQI